MSIDTLIQAAKFVDVEELDASSATMEPSTTCSSDVRAGELVDGKTLITGESQAEISRSKRTSRVSGAGATREVHNMLEKNRRAHLKICFEDLRRQLPGLEDKKTSNLSVLKAAILCIEQLKKKDRDFELETNQLRRQKRMKQEHLRLLKNEIGQEVVNDFFQQSVVKQSTEPTEESVDEEGVNTTPQTTSNEQQILFVESPITGTNLCSTTPIQLAYMPSSLSATGTRWHSHISTSRDDSNS